MANLETSIMREELRLLVDRIPEDEAPAASRKILRALMDPVELALLNAAVDDEALGT